MEKIGECYKKTNLSMEKREETAIQLPPIRNTAMKYHANLSILRSLLFTYNIENPDTPKESFLSHQKT